MLLKVFVFVASVIVCCGALAEIPSYIHICKRSDPHVAKCIRESIEVIRPKLKDGIPEIGVPGLEPLFLKQIAFLRGSDGRDLKIYMRNVKVSGASNFHVNKLKLNIDKNTYRVAVKLPLLELDGDYDIDAKLLVVNLNGQGKFKANVSDCDGQALLKGEIREKDGVKQLFFTSFDFDLKIKDFNLSFDNLFNGDPVLGQATNQVLQDNKQEFIDGALPVIQDEVAKVLLEIANQITANLDYDKVFPE